MSDYKEQVNSLREHADLIETSIELYGPSATRLLVYDLRNAAAAIEELQAEVEILKVSGREAYFEGLAAEPERGRWIHGKELSRAYIGNCCVGIDYEDFRCSACGVVVEVCEKPKWNYCPNCGAKMEVQE